MAAKGAMGEHSELGQKRGAGRWSTVVAEGESEASTAARAGNATITYQIKISRKICRGTLPLLQAFIPAPRKAFVIYGVVYGCQYVTE